MGVPLAAKLWQLCVACVLIVVALMAAVQSQSQAIADKTETRWLAALLLESSEQLHLTAEQRGQLQSILQRAKATWSALSQRMSAAERDPTANGRSDWFTLAQERGRLRVLADRDALRLLNPEQRALWRMIQSSQPRQ